MLFWLVFFITIAYYRIPLICNSLDICNAVQRGQKHEAQQSVHMLPSILNIVRTLVLKAASGLDGVQHNSQQLSRNLQVKWPKNFIRKNFSSQIYNNKKKSIQKKQGMQQNP